MDKILVVVFDSEAKAYDGSRALQDLNDDGSINLYAHALLARGDDGKVTVRQKGGAAPVGTAVGLLTGILVGLFGGPVGTAIGAGAGTLGGLVYDLAKIGVGHDFLDEIGQSLVGGEAAVVAEVQEDWTLPVDSRMEPLGGVVLRRTRRDILDTKAETDITTLRSEIDELATEYSRANDKAKITVRSKMNKARAKLEARLDDIHARLAATRSM